ncbi:glycosyltransferase family 1 protein [Pleurocapsa sp. CCALA 161]|uniref:glycosyltransferase family 4 protein n=1 Tax=Pleurocapsa sp. CCALA 161 TaxID=2107688 RepID=UPI000D077639|nr:glycosyltransferase family 1 protein [Pleurocapsa sp. CCALA 161]PSB09363.1 glycosyltransferase family 1 protein [Pleurocapsa sp. CCALA 161]
MSQLPKIAINGTYIQEQGSGLGVVNQNLIAELMNGNCLKDSLDQRQFNFRLYSQADCFKSQYPQQVIPVDPSLSPDRGFSGHIKRIFWYQTVLNQQFKHQQADLFFSPVAEGIFFPCIPQIVTVHDLIPLKYPELSPKWKYYYLYALPFLLKQSQGIICVSEYTKQDLVKNYRLDPDSINVVYNGYAQDLFYPQADPRILQQYGLDKYLLYVGDMRFYKNLSRCLEAFDSLPLKDYQFVITGKKDDFFYPEIERQTAKLAAKDRIIFLDYVPTAVLPSLYSMAQALVFASLYEGFGLPVLEAMACGCPVITSKVTSIPEVGGNSVLYVDPYSVDSIAQGMYQILTNTELKTNLIHQGLARGKLFSWELTAQGVGQVLENCLNSGN